MSTQQLNLQRECAGWRSALAAVLVLIAIVMVPSIASAQDVASSVIHGVVSLESCQAAPTGSRSVARVSHFHSQ